MDYRIALLAALLLPGDGRTVVLAADESFTPDAPALTGTGADVLPPIDAGTSLLVVSPHPDDETLCCAGVIQRVVQAGGRVTVLWITSGDAAVWDRVLIERSMRPAAALDLGARRMREARAASARLGVTTAGQLFLGYPDGGLAALLEAPRAAEHPSRSTRAVAVPYADAVSAGHPYTGESLARDFAGVLERLRPNLILAPSPEDCHPDHRAAGLLAIEVSAREGLGPQLRFWIVHGGEGWPSPRGLLPGVPLTPPPRSHGLFPAPFALTPAEEDGKHRALEAYDTQMRMMAPFLLSFVRTNELFSTRAEPRMAERAVKARGRPGG
jgi:LmbE family N-acetylglucosaminyl deacetylase